MKQNVFLGTGESGIECCLLYSLASFDELVSHRNEIESTDFRHESTNWNGRDETERTLKLCKLKLTGRTITLDKPLTFYGEDSDWGRTYPWTLSGVWVIREVIGQEDEK